MYHRTAHFIAFRLPMSRQEHNRCEIALERLCFLYNCSLVFTEIKNTINTATKAVNTLRFSLHLVFTSVHIRSVIIFSGKRYSTLFPFNDGVLIVAILFNFYCLHFTASHCTKLNKLIIFQATLTGHKPKQGCLHSKKYSQNRGLPEDTTVTGQHRPDS